MFVIHTHVIIVHIHTRITRYMIYGLASVVRDRAKFYLIITFFQRLGKNVA